MQEHFQHQVVEQALTTVRQDNLHQVLVVVVAQLMALAQEQEDLKETREVLALVMVLVVVVVVIVLAEMAHLLQQEEPADQEQIIQELFQAQ